MNSVYRYSAQTDHCRLDNMTSHTEKSKMLLNVHLKTFRPENNGLVIEDDIQYDSLVMLKMSLNMFMYNNLKMKPVISFTQYMLSYLS